MGVPMPVTAVEKILCEHRDWNEDMTCRRHKNIVTSGENCYQIMTVLKYTMHMQQYSEVSQEGKA